MPEHLVVFTPSGRRGRFAPGTTVLEAARRLGVDIDSVCGGRGICGRCQVEVSEGEHAKHAIVSSASHLSPVGAVERAFDEDRGLAAARRLGCTACVEGDLVIDVPPESQVHRQVVRKEADAHPIEIEPVVRLHYVEVEEPDLGIPDERPRPSPGRARARVAVDRAHGRQPCRRGPPERAARRWLGAAEPGLAGHGRGPRRLGRARSGPASTTSPTGSRSTSARPPWPATSATCTRDVLASAGEMNPQIRFGEDLMSRVSYVMMNPGSEKELTRAVRGCLAKLTAELANDAGVSRDDILEVTLVGNPIMHHLLLGLDPTELGGAPFALAIDEAVRRPAVGARTSRSIPGARAYVLPCIAGHVGADTAGVILSEAPHLGDEVNLIVDIGTNAEIVLGNRDRLLAASSPTGPAFEGAQISCGQRAAPGAIERVRIDPVTLEPRFRVIGSDVWSDDPAFAGTLVTGVCGSGIIEAIAELHLAGILTTDGTIDGALAARSPRIVADGRTFAYVLSAGEPELTITQNDVRQIQLAKAALHAGCTLLLERYGIERVEPDPPRRRVRQPHRPGLRARPRPGPRLRPRERHVRRECRRHRVEDRPARPLGTRRDRGCRPSRRKDRDRRRATLPGAVRRSDGDPPRHRSLREAARGRRSPSPPRRRPGRRPRAAPSQSTRFRPKEPRMTETTPHD